VDLPQAVKSAYSSIPGSVLLQYYQTRDNDTGPSNFLRAKILEMQHHEDFEDYFRPPIFGGVRCLQFGVLNPFLVFLDDE
ncbi:hypothetical protein BGZ65_009041, partial [Modicella reniformis]